MLPLNLLLLSLPLLTSAAPAIPWLSSSRAAAATAAPPPPPAAAAAVGPAKSAQNRNDVFRVSEGNSVALFNGIPVDLATGSPLRVTNINDNEPAALRKRALKKKLGLDFLDEPETNEAAVQGILRSGEVGLLEFGPPQQQEPAVPSENNQAPPEETVNAAKEMGWSGDSYMVYNGVPLRIKGGGSPTRKALALTTDGKLAKRQLGHEGLGTDGVNDDNNKGGEEEEVQRSQMDPEEEEEVTVVDDEYVYEDRAPWFGADGADDRDGEEHTKVKRQVPEDDDDGGYGYGTDGADDDDEVDVKAKRQDPEEEEEGGYGYGTDGANDDDEVLQKRDADVRDKLGLGMFDIPSVGGRKKNIAPAPPAPAPETAAPPAPEPAPPATAPPMPAPEETEQEISLDDLANGKSFVIYNGVPVEMNGKMVRNKSLKKPRPAFRRSGLQKRAAGKKIPGLNPFAPNPVTRNIATSGDTNSKGVERSSVVRSPRSHNEETVNVSKGNDYVLLNGRPVMNGMGPF